MRDRFNIPKKLWIGVTEGEWPMYAFAEQDAAAEWAATDIARRAVFEVAVPVRPQLMHGVSIPARTELRPTERVERVSD